MPPMMGLMPGGFQPPYMFPNGFNSSVPFHPHRVQGPPQPGLFGRGHPFPPFNQGHPPLGLQVQPNNQVLSNNQVPPNNQVPQNIQVPSNNEVLPNSQIPPNR